MTSCSVYLHLPFCRKRCPYCDFTSNDAQDIPYDAYQEAVGREWSLRAAALQDRQLGSVYIGGGTPSLWPSSRLRALLETVLDRACSPSPKNSLEVSVEVNPGDADDLWFGDLVEDGVNRFSIGVQALDGARLRWLGRRHTERQATLAVQAALQSGAGSVGADLIYGTPGQSNGGLKREVELFAGLGVHHVSAYELTAHPDTPLGRNVETGAVVLPDSDTMADLWHTVSATLCDHGFSRYEISNYAKPGHVCRHNAHYWEGGVYIGLGAGAWGFVVEPDGAMHRYCNTTDTGEYLRAAADPLPNGLGRGLGRGGFSELISPKTRARELVMLGLRTSRGVSLDRVLASLGPAEADDWRAIVDRLTAEGTARLVGDRFSLTEDALLLADSVAQCFF